MADGRMTLCELVAPSAPVLRRRGWRTTLYRLTAAVGAMDTCLWATLKRVVDILRTRSDPALAA